MNLGNLLNNILGSSKIPEKVATIEELSETKKVAYYQSKLKEVNEKLKSIILSQFIPNIVIESQNSVESFDKAFKNKKERDSRDKTNE